MMITLFTLAVVAAMVAQAARINNKINAESK